MTGVIGSVAHARAMLRTGRRAADGTIHRGNACTLGDIAAEWTTFVLPLILFGSPVFATWMLDYLPRNPS